RNVCLRNGPFLNRPDRLPVGAIERVCKRGLRQLDDGLHCPAAYIDVGEYRRRRWIVVPNVVMDQLLMPDTFARLDIETHQRRREEIVSGPMTPILVTCSALNRKVQIS